jgi:hypothetical protein
VGDPKATLVTMVIMGIPSHPDNYDIASAIREGQTSNPDERTTIVTL